MIRKCRALTDVREVFDFITTDDDAAKVELQSGR